MSISGESSGAWVKASLLVSERYGSGTYEYCLDIIKRPMLSNISQSGRCYCVTKKDITELCALLFALDFLPYSVQRKDLRGSKRTTIEVKG